MAKKSNRPGTPSPKYRQQQMEIARKIDAYRAAHPEVMVPDAIKAVGGDMQQPSGYYFWRKEAARANGHDHGSGESAEFPLAIIPAKAPVKAKRSSPTRVFNDRDQDRTLAAQLLEVAAALLRR